MLRRPLAGSYDPGAVERDWYERWREAGLFRPEVHPDGEPWCLVIPPPNVTGSLHMGHALENVMMDASTRFRRMQGRRALFLPGVDHAGIATQNVVEAELRKEGQTRHDLGRAKFTERVWTWKERYHERIRSQIRKLGSSCDWDRERFTMDENLSRAVRRVFVTLYRQGLLYRAAYIIQWCTRCQTALSDLEVDFEERRDKLYHVRYPGEDGGAGVVVATVRPETMFGDVAVAVNPADARYRELIGKRVRLPLSERFLPVIADDYVKMDFGTGALKITPAHDPNDFEVGRRHHLESPSVISPEGRLVGVPAAYEGLEVGPARTRVVDDLGALGVLVKEEDYSHKVGRCERCGTAVEPLISTQWFVKMAPLAEKAIAASRRGELRFIPARWEKVYLDWLENIRDWCVSRQLWWGHRIPAWYCACGDTIVADEAPERCASCGGSSLEQDPDVLDTWFSSGLWPFSTLGWPDEEAADFKTYYPTSLLITGYDIIFFWVARMSMMALHFTGSVPFREVCIHGLVRDDKGKKMSKSQGNVVDPMDVIAKHGVDPLRFALASSVTQGQDFNLSDDKFTSARFFLNKVWNASKFVIARTPEDFKPRPVAELKGLGPFDRWIIARLDAVVAEATSSMADVELAPYCRAVYGFAWNNFCDWYLELAKQDLYGSDEERKQTVLSVLHHVERSLLQLLHPIVPFTSEEIHQAVPGMDGFLMASSWPRASGVAVAAEELARVEALFEAISGLRSLRSDLGLAPSARAAAALGAAEPALRAFAEAARETVMKLAGLDRLEVVAPGESRFERALYTTAGPCEIYLEVEDVELLKRQVERLDKEMAVAAAQSERLKAKLANPGFLAKAKAEIIAKDRAELAEGELTLERLRRQRGRLDQGNL